MSTLRINNIEAKSVPASPTLDEKIKLTNSSGDVLVHIDGKTSGITTIGINTTDGNIKFDANSNIVVTGIITATKFVGTIEPTDLTVSGKVSVGGSVTAATFYGSGANLTGISGVTINNNANNRIITGSGTANTLEAETSLEWNGTNTLTVVHPSSYQDFIVTTKSGGSSFELFRAGNGPFRIRSASTSPDSSADELVIGGTSGDKGLTIFGTSNNICFGDADDSDVGRLQYVHSDNSMRFFTNTSERLRIISDGKVGINETSPQQQLHVHDDTIYNGILINGSNAPRIGFARQTTTSGEWSVGIDGTNGNNFAINKSNDNSYRKLIITSSQIQMLQEVSLSANLKIANPGSGIDFSAAGNAGGMTSELLDDYEEGSWTPAYSRPNMTLTHGNQHGWYTKVGRVVHVVGWLNTTSESGSSSGGPILVTGLPFTVRQTRCALSVRPSSWSNDHPSFASFEKDQTFFELLEEVEGNPSGSGDLGGGRFAGGNGNYLWFSGSYFTDS